MRNFIIVILVIASHLVYGQNTAKVVKKNYPAIIEMTQDYILDKLQIPFYKDSLVQNFRVYSPSMAHTAFFCKIEDKIGKSSKLPLKMRLGDIDMVNRIEGKDITKLNAH